MKTVYELCLNEKVALENDMETKIDKLSSLEDGDIPAVGEGGGLKQSGMNRDASGNLNATSFSYGKDIAVPYESLVDGTKYSPSDLVNPLKVVLNNGEYWVVRSSFYKSNWEDDSRVGRFILPGAKGNGSAAWGDMNYAYGDGATAEGQCTKASGAGAHSEGQSTDAIGSCTHAEGLYTTASGAGSHAEGISTKTIGNYSHTEGLGTIANNTYEHAQGEYNASHTGSDRSQQTANSIGVGTSSKRQNAVEVMKDGKVFIYGLAEYDGTNPTAENVKDLATVISAKADDAAVVKLSGDQDIFGQKTFNNGIRSIGSFYQAMDSSLTSDALEIAKVDNRIGFQLSSMENTYNIAFPSNSGTIALAEETIGLSGNQEIYGTKTFNDIAALKLKVFKDNNGLATIYFTNRDGEERWLALPQDTATVATLTDIAPQFMSGSSYELSSLVVHTNQSSDEQIFCCINPEGHQGPWNESDFAPATVESVLAALRSQKTITPDSKLSIADLSSIQEAVSTNPSTGVSTKYYQLFDFNKPHLQSYKLSDDLDIVVRDRYTTSGNGAKTSYISLSGLAEKIADEVTISASKVDTQHSQLSSIDYNDGNLELRNFHLLQNEDIPSQYPIAGSEYDLVLRKRLSNNRVDIKYTDLSAFLDGLHLYIDDDTEFVDNTSIGWSLSRSHDQTTGKEYVGLLNFNHHGSETLEASLEYGKSKYVVLNGNGTSADASTDFLLWNKDHNGKPYLDYTDIKITLPRPKISDVEDLGSQIVDISSAANPELLEELSSERWKCSGTHDDNCYGQSIGNSSQVLAIDIDNGGLWYESSQTLDWHACELYDQNGQDDKGSICLNWAYRQGYNLSGNATLDWKNCKLYEEHGTVYTVDWNNGILYHPIGGIDTVDWSSCFLRNPTDGSIAVDWSSRMLNDANAYSSVEWGNRYLVDSNARVAVDWDNRQLNGNWSVDGNFTIISGNTLTIGNTTITENQLQQLLALLQ